MAAGLLKNVQTLANIEISLQAFFLLENSLPLRCTIHHVTHARAAIAPRPVFPEMSEAYLENAMSRCCSVCMVSVTLSVSGRSGESDGTSLGMNVGTKGRGDALLC